VFFFRFWKSRCRAYQIACNLTACAQDAKAISANIGAHSGSKSHLRNQKRKQAALRQPVFKVFVRVKNYRLYTEYKASDCLPKSKFYLLRGTFSTLFRFHKRRWGCPPEDRHCTNVVL